MNFIKLLSFPAIILISFTAKAQCGNDCCKKEKTTKNSTVVKPVVIVETGKKKELVCKLTSPELRKRKEEVIAVLKTKVLETVELENGYRYKFAHTDKIVEEIKDFIKSENACCEFFELAYTTADKIIWLTISGPEGAKEFIKTELEM